MTTARLIVHGVGYVCLGGVALLLGYILRARDNRDVVSEAWRKEHRYHKGGD